MSPAPTLLGPPRFKRKQLVGKLARRLKGRCVRAYLFGSYARGEAHAQSDVDLIIIAQTERPFVERFKDYLDIVQALAPVDLLVYTPQEWTQSRKTPGTLPHRARRELVRLYPL